MNSEKCIEYGKYLQTHRPQCGHPKRAGLPDVNINTCAQSINTERKKKWRLELLGALRILGEAAPLLNVRLGACCMMGRQCVLCIGDTFSNVGTDKGMKQNTK